MEDGCLQEEWISLSIFITFYMFAQRVISKYAALTLTLWPDWFPLPRLILICEHSRQHLVLFNGCEEGGCGRRRRRRRRRGCGSGR